MGVSFSMPKSLKGGDWDLEVRIRGDSVEISGYVNAIERKSKVLSSRAGQFVERICKGAFKRAIERNDDIKLLLNHNWDYNLGSTKNGNLELYEDNIGLRAEATITDEEVVKKARNNELVGWSFGFEDREVTRSMENGVTTRDVHDLNLFEVSILDNTRSPAYEGNILSVRSKEQFVLFSEPLVTKCNLVDETPKEQTKERSEEQPKPEPEKPKEIDYSKYEEMIKEMKGEQK